MELSDIGTLILGGLIGRAPFLAAWIFATTMAVIMMRRGGDRAEHFFLIGSALMLLGNLLYIPLTLIVPWLVASGMSATGAASRAGGYGMCPGLVSLAGIVCLVYVFWIKFKVKSHESCQS